MSKNNPNSFVKEIMKELEKRGFTQGPAEEVPVKLQEELKMNSERTRKSKPFTVHEI